MGLYTGEAYIRAAFYTEPLLCLEFITLLIVSQQRGIEQAILLLDSKQNTYVFHNSRPLASLRLKKHLRGNIHFSRFIMGLYLGGLYLWGFIHGTTTFDALISGGLVSLPSAILLFCCWLMNID